MPWEVLSPRTVFAPYTRLFGVPGAARFSLAGWLGRLPASTTGLGTVLLVSGRTGSYALAGSVSGTFALSYSVGSPAWARWVDRRGQGAVLNRSVLAFLVLGAGFVAAVVARAPIWSWFALAALTGASTPNVGSLVRARWAHALAEPAARRTAFAFESVVDEVVFVVGPPVVTVLAALASPPAGFLTGLVLGVAGMAWLAAQVPTEPPAHPRRQGATERRWAALSPAVLVVTASWVAVGGVFGAMDVVVVGFARAQGSPTVAGAALAAYAAGSLVAGLVYGLARLPGTLETRFAACSLLFGLAAQLLLVVGSLPVLVPVSFLAGLAIAPTLVSGMSLVEARVPRAALTESLSWTTAGLTAGVTAGAALAGAAVDRWGARPAFAVPALAAALAAVLALAGTAVLRR
ncbi:MAG: major facilitator superfamily 1, partial [Frankiales bacterium]|nr:major facilitator superfamily 1 [Frankiales bacterium]